MSEPIPPPPPNTPPPPAPGGPETPQRPFTGTPRALPGGGCGRPLLIGCGVVAVLLGIAGIVLVAKAKDLLVWTMGQLRDEVVSAMPADVTAEERQRLDRAFEAASAKIRSGDIESPALFALQRQLTKAAEKAQQKSLTRDDVLDLLSALERVGGLLRPDADEAPPPATSDPGTGPQPSPGSGS